MSDQSDADAFRNPLARKKPLGGPVGVAVASILPLIALALFLLFGFLGGWNWSWVFFLLIPISAIIVYGFPSREPR